MAHINAHVFKPTKSTIAYQTNATQKTGNFSDLKKYRSLSAKIQNEKLPVGSVFQSFGTTAGPYNCYKTNGFNRY